MKPTRLVCSVLILSLTLIFPLTMSADISLGYFKTGSDLFIADFDSKTDVDDVHSIAGVATMLRDPRFADVQYHAVAGAYGIQEGLYVPSPELFNLVFGDNWSDAHLYREQALDKVTQLVMATLASGGNVWVAEAGQSDFTADWLTRVRESDLADMTKTHIHVVQHSDWNESVTSPGKLAYVQEHANYHKIADGNEVGNGTPGFRTESTELWAIVFASPEDSESWLLAKSIGEEYNGVDGRYENSAITAGGMDFSDVSETCWIFGFADLEDAEAFFREFPGTGVE